MKILEIHGIVLLKITINILIKNILIVSLLYNIINYINLDIKLNFY